MRICFAVIIAMLVSMPRPALAVQTYPAEIRNHLSLGATPPCTLCHATNDGGVGTIVTSFGQAMMSAGLTTNIDTLGVALDKLRDAQVDSNGDGVTDIEQLKGGVNPNTGSPYSNTEPEQYGCGARIATPSRNHVSAKFAIMVAGLLALVSHRRFLRRLRSSEPYDR